MPAFSPERELLLNWLKTQLDTPIVHRDFNPRSFTEMTEPMYEHKRKPLLSTRAFLVRVAGHILAASILILVSLIVGVVGYHWLDQLNWVDSVLNASMILGGMGPVDPLHTTAAK